MLSIAVDHDVVTKVFPKPDNTLGIDSAAVFSSVHTRSLYSRALSSSSEEVIFVRYFMEIFFIFADWLAQTTARSKNYVEKLSLALDALICVRISHSTY